MPAPGDPYALLGLSAEATEKDIKSAFRALAKECHPDVAGDDPVKTERFKALRAAYELLSDPSRRAAWDRRAERKTGASPFYGSHWRNAGKPAPGTKGPNASGQDLDLEDIFNDFGGIDFGFGKSAGKGPAPGRPAGSPRGNPNPTPRSAPRPSVNQWNPVDDFRKAAEDDSWPGADGAGGTNQGFGGGASRGERPTGASPGWHHQAKSSGRRREPQTGSDVELQADVPADVAHRGGTVELHYRRRVRGDDLFLHETAELHEFRVPPGVRDGEVLRVEKSGHAGENGGAYGDLLVRVRLVAARASPVEPPPGATQAPRMKMPKHEPATEVQEQTVEVDVQVADAILGGRAEVNTHYGRVRITIPAGTSSGTRLRLRGRGKPNDEGDSTDLYAVVRIVVPSELDDESKDLIERFRARRGP